ncbi:MAG: methyltransferase domain-containing protein [Rhodospirillaceae bacterium]|jgi:SAM-dependent methyltransferase|nr:methyltransferase domain-containing protein [Rhodospirillaceae bacterium]
MNTRSGFQLKGTGPEIYESCFVPAQMGRFATHLVDAAAVSAGDTVLDVACGTGVVARAAARKAGTSGSITGVDLNESMLEVARQVAAEQGLPHIQWKQCDAGALPFEDGAFYVVLCQQGLQFMPDKAAAVMEMARVLAPGGRLAVSVWKAQSPLGAALGTVLERHFGDGSTADWQVMYALGNRDKIRAFATDAGLREAHVSFDVKVSRHAEPEAFIGGMIAGSPLAGEVAKLTEGEQRSIVQEILKELEDYLDDDGVAVPAGCLTLTARK